MSTKWVDIYKKHYDTVYSTDNSGLHNLLNDFFREEPLDGDYHCLKCPKLTKARQKSDLCLPLPRVLILQLKRFTYDIYSNDKIDTYISFPLDELDLNEYLVKDDSKINENSLSTKYDLVAVSNHTGSLTSGHYTTYAKNIQNGKWYLFDDTVVRKLDNNTDVVTKNAYILIYVQKSNDRQ
jgi:ubiquitin C-terminal hydrolase